MTLTKAHIVESFQNELGFSKHQSIDVVEQLLEIIKCSLANGDALLISRFGKFCTQDKRARKGRNPATGEDMMLRPRRIVSFQCSPKLKKKLNSGSRTAL